MAKNTEKKGALGMFENMSSVSTAAKEKPLVKEKPANSKKAAEASSKNTAVKAKDEASKMPVAEKKTEKEVKKEIHEEKIVEITAPVVENIDEMPKKTSGRPNTRGKKGKDFQLINIAVPNDVYNKLRELSYEKAAGNMTFFINKILKEAIDNN